MDFKEGFWCMGKKKRNKVGQASLNGSSLRKQLGAKSASPQDNVVGISIPKLQRPRLAEVIAVLLASILAFWFLTARLSGVKVSVMSDEYSYLLDTNFNPLSEAKYPNHLFQLIYSSTKLCGPEFYECARSINAVFVIASAIVMYLLAKKISGKKLLASLSGLVMILGSFGTYTAYFMPEAIFNFFMVLFIACLIIWGAKINLWFFLSVGFLLGIASTAKPHGLFLIPAVMIWLFISARSQGRNLRFAILSPTLFFTGAVLGDLGLGFLIAGPKGFSFFGVYGQVGDAVSAVAETVSRDLSILPTTSFGQVLMVAMTIGFAVPVSLLALWHLLCNKPEAFINGRFGALFALSLINMTAVSAAFEAWYTGATWMHTRYYSYLIPLALVVLIEAFCFPPNKESKKPKLLLGGVFIGIALFALFTTAAPYSGNWIDSPDFKAHIDNPLLSSLVIVCSIVLTSWWMLGGKGVMQPAIGLMLLASFLGGQYTSDFLREKFGASDAYERVGRLLSSLLPQEDVDKVVLYGHQDWLMQRTLFYSMSGRAQLFNGPETELYSFLESEEARWLVKFGEPLANKPQAIQITGVGFSMYGLDSHALDGLKVKGVESASNLCTSDLAKEWLCSVSGIFRLTEILPENAAVNLVFEIREGTEGVVQATLGDSQFEFKVSGGLYALPVNFQNSLPSSEIEFKWKGTLPNSAEELGWMRSIAIAKAP